MKNLLLLTALICFAAVVSAQKNRIFRDDNEGVLYVNKKPFTGSFIDFCSLEGNCPSGANSSKLFIVLPNFGVPNRVKYLVSISIYTQEVSNRYWYRVAFLEKESIEKIGDITKIELVDDNVVITGSKNEAVFYRKKSIKDESITWVQVR